MKKRLLSIFLSCVLLLSALIVQIPAIADLDGWDIWDGSSVSTSLSGSGTYSDPYLIESAADLKYFVDTAKKDGNYYQGQYVLLNINIDLADKAFPMIYKFSGILDGNGYEIKGINITNTNSATTNIAFIQYLDGTVRNLTLTGNVTSAGQNVGGFASSISTSGTSIINCVNNINVTGTSCVGGFVGNAYPGSETTLNIISCVNNGTITATSAKSNAGGFIGYTRAYAKFNIYHSQNNGDVIGSGSGVAGFLGNNFSTSLNFKYCINAGEISGTAAVGGIFGINNNNAATGAIANCVNYGKITTIITGSTANLGAIAGYYASNVSSTKISVVNTFYCQDDIDFAASSGDGQTGKTPLGTAKEAAEFADGTVANALGFLYVQGEENPELRTYSAGKGSKANPYVIKTKEDLILLSQMVTVTQMSNYADMAFELGNDIDLENDARFVGIGNRYKTFNGDFDGKGYTVKSFNIGDGSGTYSAHPEGIGFFGVIAGTNERKISNLNVIGSVISTAATTTKTYVGGLVGRNLVKLTIENCSFNGTVKSTYKTDANYPAASGLVCSAEGALDISGCSVFGKIDGYGRGGSFVGSLNGNFAVNITNSYSVAEVTGVGSNTATTSPTAGGLVGFVDVGTLRLNNCFYAGTAPAARASGFAGPIVNWKQGGTIECTNVYYDSTKNGAESEGYSFGAGKTTTEFKNGTVLALLNANKTIFEQSANHPKFVGQKLNETVETPDDDDDFDADQPDGKTYVKWDGSVSTSLSGTGTNVDPFVIKDGADLKYFAEQVNSGNDYSGKFIALAANIDLNNLDFDPIGNRAKWFRGVFDGRGYTVKNVNIVSESTNGIGFFGGCHNATIKNLTVKGKVRGTVCTTATPVAGIVAIAVGGAMENCAFIGTVYSANATLTFLNYPAASGLVCAIEGNYDIDRCYVSGKIDGYGRSGGLIGSVNGGYNVTITNSYCDANVTGVGAETTNAPTAGGLIGFLNTGTITLDNCYFAGTAPAIRSAGMGGPIINHYAGGTLNCFKVFYLADKPSEFTAHNFGENKTAAQFMDGTVNNLLNDGELNPIFMQGEKYPVIIPVAMDDGTITDKYLKKYTFDNNPGSVEVYNSYPKKYQNDGYYIDTIDGVKQLGSRLYNYGRYNNNAILAPSAKYANGVGYGVPYTAKLGGVFCNINLSDIKANAFYRFSLDVSVIGVKSDVTVQIGLFRCTGANVKGQLSFQDFNGNTYDTAIKAKKLTLNKKSDFKTYTVEISGNDILSFLENYSDNANVLYFGVYCPNYINKDKYADEVLALDNFEVFETEVPATYVPADSLPAVDILDENYKNSYGEHMYNAIENPSFENELKGVWANLPKGFSVKTGIGSDAMFGQKYLSANAKSGTVKMAIPFSLTINKFYTFGISTRTSSNAKYRIYFSDSKDGAPLYDVDDESQKFVIDTNSKNGEIVRSGIYFRNTMKTTATQYLIIEVSKGTVDFDEITLTKNSTTEKNRNYYEKTGDTIISVYDALNKKEKEFTVPFGKLIYDMVKEIKEWLK